MEDVGGDNDPVSQLFDQFCHATTCKAILSTFQQLCDHVGLSHADHRHFYRRLRARVNTWKAHALWVKLDKRAAHKEYRRGDACSNTNVSIVIILSPKLQIRCFFSIKNIATIFTISIGTPYLLTILVLKFEIHVVHFTTS